MIAKLFYKIEGLLNSEVSSLQNGTRVRIAITTSLIRIGLEKIHYHGTMEVIFPQPGLPFALP